MAYNKKYFYRRVAEIQDIVIKEQQNGASLTWIYRNKIRRQFHISKSTFDNYLGIPAKAELKKLEECLNNKDK
jgi:hypothetical protein